MRDCHEVLTQNDGVLELGEPTDKDRFNNLRLSRLGDCVELAASYRHRLTSEACRVLAEWLVVAADKLDESL